MDKNKFASALIVIAAAGSLLTACSVNVQKDPDGQDKRVDIKTFAGNIHVDKGADARDTGLTVYPGASLKEKDSGDDKSANVNISGFGYGLKVVALEYESSDAPAKVISFYKDQMKKYGVVLECRTTSLHVSTIKPRSKDDSNKLTCDGQSGSDVELKAGRGDDQHIVAVEPNGTGSSFSLVYVRTYGKDTDI